MRTPICEKLGCDLPIFAFSHCRDVVVEVTKAGGFGVLGASTFSPEQLETELCWIDEHVGGRPYGVDVIIPTKYDKQSESSTQDLEKLIPDEHRAFLDKILDDAGVPPLPEDERERIHASIVHGRGNMTPDGARRLLRVALTHPQVKLVVSALGSPPPDIVAELRERGVMIGAMCGKGEHAARHRAAGVQLIVAQGTEAGGHTGDIATMVLVPQVVEACGDDVAVLAAGGIAKGSQIAAALALGAQGVWCGSLWLGTRESELDPFEKEVLFETKTEDAVRRRARTGKPVRMIKSLLSEAWEQPGAPAYLPTPLQGILYNEAHARVVRAKRKDLYSFPVGQVVGMLNEESSVRDVMYRLQLEYIETMERLHKLSPSDA
ncbi:nitronate monooxygenase family protein [Glaciimonas sp. Gout2]|uniref:nitronate monooxygenase n=1 Tax=unclassified Glaciimonas TaxID=2644401 RepID=UPI002B23603D|nr:MULTISPECIES: nitronate monooxygenase family protein [unclassified Glaciimonas]MEB0013834.1 nitronate monooxygenase family protein [Glaciimonas sp. Cout2]MEB0083063.1 nitronate monooxygenase family protein [Glaciimonas sp. Gout2]